MRMRWIYTWGRGAGIRQRSKWLLVSCGDFVSKSLVVFDFYMFGSPPHWSLFSLFFNPFETSSKKQQHTHRVRMLVRSLLPRTSPCRMGPRSVGMRGVGSCFDFSVYFLRCRKFDEFFLIPFACTGGVELSFLAGWAAQRNWYEKHTILNGW